MIVEPVTEPSTEEYDIPATLYEAINRGYEYCLHSDYWVGCAVKMKNGEDVAYITLRDQIEVEWVNRGLL